MELPTFVETEINGVKTLFIEQPGLTQVGLSFRVGRNDDPLPQLGISHLVEHLTLHDIGDVEYDYNAYVTPLITTFHCRGSSEEANQFLNLIANGLELRDLTLVEHELRVLSAENERNGAPPCQRGIISKYGTRSLGRTSMLDFVESTYSDENLIAFRDQYFTQQNAILFICAPSLDEIELPQLRQGSAQSAPETPPFVQQNRLWTIDEDPNSIDITATGALNAADLVAFRVLENRLRRELRAQRGIAYSVESNFIEADATHLECGMSISIDAKRDTEAVDVVLQLINEFTAGDLSDEEVARVNRAAEREVDEPDFTFNFLRRTGEQMLLGQSTPLFSEQVSLESAQSAAVAMRNTFFAVLPTEPTNTTAWERERELPNDAPVVGKKVKLRTGLRSQTYIVGEAGISAFVGKNVGTIFWDDVSAFILEVNDERVILKNTSDSISFYESLKGEEIAAAVEQHIPESLYIDRRTSSFDELEDDRVAIEKPFRKDYRTGFKRRSWPERIALGVLALSFLPIYLKFPISQSLQGNGHFVPLRLAAAVATVFAIHSGWFSLKRGFVLGSFAMLVWSGLVAALNFGSSLQHATAINVSMLISLLLYAIAGAIILFVQKPQQAVTPNDSTASD